MDIKTIKENLLTQDNRATHLPMFCVQEQYKVPVWNREDSPHTAIFVPEWNESFDSEQEFEEFCKENEYEGDDIPEYREYGYDYDWEDVCVCLTEEGCKEHLRLNGHNYGKTRIYVKSFYRNPEMEAILEFIRKFETEVEG